MRIRYNGAIYRLVSGLFDSSGMPTTKIPKKNFSNFKSNKSILTASSSFELFFFLFGGKVHKYQSIRLVKGMTLKSSLETMMHSDYPLVLPISGFGFLLKKQHSREIHCISK